MDSIQFLLYALLVVLAVYLLARAVFAAYFEAKGNYLRRFFSDGKSSQEQETRSGGRGT